MSSTEAIEWLPVVDENGNVIGKASRTDCHKGEKILHPVVHLHIINSQNELLLQKRPLNKLIQPGKWDTAVGGHVDYGEDVQTSLIRETFEEIGVKNFIATQVLDYIWETEIEKEYVYSFILKYDGGFNINESEVDEILFWKPSDIDANLGKGVFTENFEKEYNLIKQNLKLD